MEGEVVKAGKISLASKVKGYILVTKPRLIYLLVFTSIGGMVAAAGPAMDWGKFIKAFVAITAGCAGANTITCYIDRDIDAVMERTRRRPLPQGIISPAEALAWGIVLSAVALILSASLNGWAFFWMLLGLFDNIVIYSLLSKRRTPWNIVLGSISGGAPTLFGWAAMRGDVAILPFLMAALVVLWIPGHIWSLALRYRDDYAKAGVPMLPVVTSEQKVLHCIVSTSLLMFIASILIHIVGRFGLIYTLLAYIPGAALVAVNLYLWARPTPKNAWLAFKVTSPYLAALFLGIILDSLL